MQVTKQPHVYEVFASVGAASLLEFRSQFQRLHDESPLRAAKLFLYYLGCRGLDPIAQAMAFWATSGTMYISLLLDTSEARADSLSPEIASHALPHLNELDPQFLFKLARSMAALTEPAALLRALTLAPALGDYSILIPWLRSLVHHSNTHVRSRAAKILCQLRPNKGLLSRHMQSPDPRVRASVMEALWQPKILPPANDILPLFRSALADPNHRVVANALVGLYRFGETDALLKMIALSSDKQHMFRAATAWAMGVVDDSRAVPILRQLRFDPSFTVRQRAATSLHTLLPLETDIYDTVSDLQVLPA